MERHKIKTPIHFREPGFFKVIKCIKSSRVRVVVVSVPDLVQGFSVFSAKPACSVVGWFLTQALLSEGVNSHRLILDGDLEFTIRLLRDYTDSRRIAYVK